MEMEMVDVYGIKTRGQGMPVPSTHSRRHTVTRKTADGCQQAWMQTHEDETQAAQQ